MTALETLVSDLDPDQRAAYWQGERAEARTFVTQLVWLRRMHRVFEPLNLSTYAGMRAGMIDKYARGVAAGCRPGGTLSNPGAGQHIAAGLDRYAPQGAS